MGLFSNIKNIFSSNTTEEEGIGVSLLTKEQKTALLGVSCHLCSPIFIPNRTEEGVIIVIAFMQMLGLTQEDLDKAVQKQEVSDIQKYITSIKTIQKEKSLILFNAIWQKLISISDNKHLITTVYKRILMGIGYSSEDSDGILDGTYFNNRDIEAYKPNHNSSSVLDLIIEYLEKECREPEKDTNEVTSFVPEEAETFIDNENQEVEDNNPEYYVPTFLHNWDFTDFLCGRNYDMQIKELVNRETGDLEKYLVLEDSFEGLIYLALYPGLDNLSISEIIEKKFDLYVGITEQGNFWLHDKSKIHYMESIY